MLGFRGLAHLIGFGTGARAGGSSGWQAPEQLISRSGGEVRQSKSVDVFSLGLVLFYCLSGGRHAFGESYERDFNILQVRSSAHAAPCPGVPASCRSGRDMQWHYEAQSDPLAAL